MNETFRVPEIVIEPHPLLEAGLLAVELPGAVGESSAPDWLRELLEPDADAPFAPDDRVRAAVRELLRHTGHKPAGRGKPASEFLWRAASRDGLRSINLAVDVCNVISLHSGLPISVVDLGQLTGALRIGVAPTGSSYVFNPSGQEIRLDGMLCLHDASGPCANAVKDSQRTKTGEATTRTLTVIWGTQALDGRTARALDWYRELVERVGSVCDARLAPAPT